MKRLLILAVLFFAYAFLLHAQQRPFTELDGGRIARDYYNQNLRGTNPGQQSLNTEAMSVKKLTGNAASGQFGISVAPAGDVNGDGYIDVVVGAFAANSYAGRAYVYFGGEGMDATPDYILQPLGATENFGWSVAGLGDVNGDGFSDFAVGAYMANSNLGRVYVYFGGADMDTYYDLLLNGEFAGGYFGTSIAGPGDVNGDGFNDILVGANGASGNAGKAFLFYGNALPDPTYDVVFTPPSGTYFGSKVAGVGDVNGDGYPDIAVGQHPFNSNTGRVFVYYGGAAMDAAADVTINGSSTGSYFGYGIAGNGDINGDGYGDLAVSAYGEQRVYICFGGAAMSGVPDRIISNSSAASFGAAIALADLNADGYSDILVGASSVNSNTGRLYGYFGGARVNDVPDFSYDGEAAGNGFGSALAALGDMNNDGFEDFIAGAYAYNAYRGRAYVFTNTFGGVDVPDIRLSGTAPGIFGLMCTNTGDVNGDGYEDNLVGAQSLTPSIAGSAYLYYGGPNPPAPLAFTGDSAGFGRFFADRGDINGDGYSDVVISDPSYSVYRGRIYIYLGGPSPDNIADYVITGDSTYRYYGYAITKSSDLNGDGINDLVVGGPGSASYYRFGKIDIYNGSTSFSTTPGRTISYNSFNGFGASLACGGDLNKDGFDDLITAEKIDNSSAAVSVFNGTASGVVSYPDYIRVDSLYLVNYNYSTLSLSIDGDINNDGYDDIVIGAGMMKRQATSDGAIYCYYGGAMLDTNADVSMYGDNGFVIGDVIRSGGDINNDGYADILTYCYSISYDAAVFLGGNSMDGKPDVFLYPAGTMETGWLDYAGDQNQDGMTDISFAEFNSAAQGLPGELQIFLSSSPKTPPRIITIKDINGDQGGKVNLKWLRCGYDAPGSGKSIYYLVERSPQPVNGQYAWELLETVDGLNNLYYNYTASTPSDSMTGHTGNYYFRVTAGFYYQAQSWKSNIMIGHSVDNISPAPVLSFAGSPVGMNNGLHWKANTETDLHSYAIYRAATNSIDPNAVTPVATLTDTLLTDTNVPIGDSYYFIRAKDIHGNYSALSTLATPLGMREVSVTALIEGFYDENANTMIQDTLTVALHNASAPYARVEQSQTFLNTTGMGAVRMRAAENTGNYYVVVKHRNAIETWSKQPQAMADSRISYDFTTAATTAYGDNLKQKGSKWCIFSGDVNQDGIVDYSDLSAIDNDSYNYVGGYVTTDVTGDEFVDYTDLTIADNNNFNYVSVQSPLALLKKGTTAQTDNTSVPTEYEVSRNYPNPFNPSTRINYALPQDSRVVVNLFNMLGEKIATLIDREEGAGYHTALINMNNLPSGAYILHFTAGDYRRVQKIMLMK